MNKIVFALIFISSIYFSNCRWTTQKAWQWYNNTSWSAGCNYIPAYAVNQIQMWENFDLNAIDKELRWAASIGFTKFRTFLHIQPFLNNKSQFLKNIWKYLAILKSYKSQAILVLFDDCWHAEYHSGPQPEPIPGIHNSRWVQCPGKVVLPDSTYQDYVTTVLKTFEQNQNIAFWDLYNQVGNGEHFQFSLPLLKKVFTWARLVNPSQPLSSCIWKRDILFQQIINFIYSQADIITFHAYCDTNCTQNWIADMKSIFFINFSELNRPVVCTQYMARELNSKFITHLPLFKKQNVWAINWGLVFGRTQTYYPWWSYQGAPVPKVWFHDVLHPNGTAFDEEETLFIKNITQVL